MPRTSGKVRAQTQNPDSDIITAVTGREKGIKGREMASLFDSNTSLRQKMRRRQAATREDVAEDDIGANNIARKKHLEHAAEDPRQEIGANNVARKSNKRRVSDNNEGVLDDVLKHELGSRSRKLLAASISTGGKIAGDSDDTEDAHDKGSKPRDRDDDDDDDDDGADHVGHGSNDAHVGGKKSGSRRRHSNSGSSGENNSKHSDDDDDDDGHDHDHDHDDEELSEDGHGEHHKDKVARVGGAEATGGYGHDHDGMATGGKRGYGRIGGGGEDDENDDENSDGEKHVCLRAQREEERVDAESESEGEREEGDVEQSESEGEDVCEEGDVPQDESASEEEED